MCLYHRIVITGWKQKSLLLLMLLTLTGGQWALLQSVAWAGMLASRLQTQCLPEAITTTFDGRHPCPLCKAVQAGRKSEHKSEVVAKFPRSEFPPMEPGCVVADLNARPSIGVSDESAESLTAPPLLRPPRPFFL